jgi:hypothetical protein
MPKLRGLLFVATVVAGLSIILLASTAPFMTP